MRVFNLIVISTDSFAVKINNILSSWRGMFDLKGILKKPMSNNGNWDETITVFYLLSTLIFKVFTTQYEYFG